MEIPEWVYDAERYKFERIEELYSTDRITRFDLDKGKIWFLDDSNVKTAVDTELANELVSLREVTKKYGGYGNCGFIASDIKGLSPMAIGRLSGGGTNKDGSNLSKFVAHANHFVSFMKLPDGTFAAADYAIGREIERDLLSKNQEVFDVLVLRSNTIDDLIRSTSKLYGGVWKLSDY